MRLPRLATLLLVALAAAALLPSCRGRHHRYRGTPPAGGTWAAPEQPSQRMHHGTCCDFAALCVEEPAGQPPEITVEAFCETCEPQSRCVGAEPIPGRPNCWRPSDPTVDVRSIIVRYHGLRYQLMCPGCPCLMSGVVHAEMSHVFAVLTACDGHQCAHQPGIPVR